MRELCLASSSSSSSSFFRMMLAVFVVIAATTSSSISNDDDEKANSDNNSKTYGVDVSWPMQHHRQQQQHQHQHEDDGTINIDNSNQRYTYYQEYMQGCAEAYSAELCQKNDADRIAMNARQPSLVHMNFTSTGYAKVAAPAVVYELLRDLWNHHHSCTLHHLPQQDSYYCHHYYLNEYWQAGNIHMNHWKAPSQVLLLHDPDHDDHDHDDDSYGLTTAQRQLLLRQVQSVLETWTGVSLIPTFLYGIRIYREGSILAPHVDRLPLVISAIINVAQEAVQEDWILELIGHDGIAVNVTMQPGEMVMYESHSIIHGRPYPLKAKAYANVFVHFEPVGYTDAFEEKLRSMDRISPDAVLSTREKFEQALRKAHHQQQTVRKETPKKSIPSYIEEHSQEASRWRQQFVFFKDEPKQQQQASKPQKGAQTHDVTQAHRLAASGELKSLQQLAKVDPNFLTLQDANGWTPLHEAARSGHTKVVEYLIEKGSDVNARTNDGEGATPLWWAQHYLPATHPTIELLRKHGAVAIAGIVED